MHNERDVNAKWFLVVCARHGEECYSAGYFRTREEAEDDIAHTSGHLPSCGSALRVVPVEG